MQNLSSRHVRFSSTENLPSPIETTLSDRRISITTINTAFLEVLELAEKIKDTIDLETIVDDLESDFEEKRDALSEHIKTSDLHSAGIVRLVESSSDANDEVHYHIINLKFNKLSNVDTKSFDNRDAEKEIYESEIERRQIINECFQDIENKINTIVSIKNELSSLFDSDETISESKFNETFISLQKQQISLFFLFQKLRDNIYDSYLIDYPYDDSELEYDITKRLATETFPKYFDLKTKWQTAKLGELSLRHLQCDAQHEALNIEDK